MPASEHDPRVTAWLDTVGASVADTIQHDPRATIEPPSPIYDTASRHAVQVLQQLTGKEAISHIEVARTLGQGGMGVIREATQVALHRTVAVKSLRADRKSDGAVLNLLREAWVTGALEHPNVVPVHDIGLDQDGSPLIVLKRIEGVSWSDLMGDADTVRERFGADDLLEWNLGILLQVINAVRFAHSRGIIHRDLKPDNVMIGEFGEVYVLDWGIAVSVRDDTGGRLPHASEARDMAGTPCYMAPEMLGQSPTPPSERTDIYLLGAILFEIISGRPPHLGDTVSDIVSSVIASAPEVPEDAPAALVRICRRAMAPDPEQRFERAEALKLAIQEFLQHRGSAHLADEARRRLRELLELLDAPAEADAEWRQRLYKLFGACRFGFQEALASWRDNQAARDGLREAIIAMAEHELDSGDPRAAAALVAELADTPADLRARIDRALDQKESEKQRIAALEKLGRDLDMAAGARTRSFIAGVMALLWTAIPLAAAFLGYEGATLSHAEAMMWTFGFFAMLAALGVWARESMTKTVVNRRVMIALLFLFTAQLTVQIGGWLMGIDLQRILVLYILLWFCTAGLLTITVDLYILPVTVSYLVAFLIAAWRPSLVLYAMAAGNLVLFLTSRAMWHRFEPYYAEREAE